MIRLFVWLHQMVSIHQENPFQPLMIKSIALTKYFQKVVVKKIFIAVLPHWLKQQLGVIILQYFLMVALDLAKPTQCNESKYFLCIFPYNRALGLVMVQHLESFLELYLKYLQLLKRLLLKRKTSSFMFV